MAEFTMIPPSGLPPRGSAKAKRKRVVAVAFPDGGPAELIGPLEIFNEANYILDYFGRSDLGYDIEIVTTEPGVVHEMDGLKIVADKPYHAVRGSVDTLLVPPMDLDERCLQDEQFLVWLKRMSSRVRRVAGVCIATYALAEAGLLNDRRATTHWAACDDFRRRYPKVQLQTDPIYVMDGNVYTSAGATSGLDMMLALVEEDYGKDLALRVAQGLVMYLQRPGNQAQFSVHVAAPLPEESRFREIQNYVTENLDGDLTVESLADRAGMSPRNFARVFSRKFGITPGRYVEQSRLEGARQYLERSRIPVSEVAKRCGFRTADGMRVAFDRNLGVSPREYRRRFSTAQAG